MTKKYTVDGVIAKYVTAFDFWGIEFNVHRPILLGQEGVKGTEDQQGWQISHNHVHMTYVDTPLKKTAMNQFKRKIKKQFCAEDVLEKAVAQTYAANLEKHLDDTAEY